MSIPTFVADAVKPDVPTFNVVKDPSTAVTSPDAVKSPVIPTPPI